MRRKRTAQSVPGGAKMVDALRAELAGARAETSRWRKRAEEWKDRRALRIYIAAIERCAAERREFSVRLHDAMCALDEMRAERQSLVEKAVRS